MQTPAPAEKRTRASEVAPALRLRFAYDAYLSSMEALYAQRANAREIASNVGRQEDVFAERMAGLRRDLRTLNESWAAENGLRAEKAELTEMIELLETINTNVTFDDEDKKTVMLFADTASKVVIKNFHELSADNLNTVNKMMDEIIESLKSFECQSKIDVRNKLKDLLIQMATLTKKLNQLKLKCEDKFKEEESLQNYNSSLIILEPQFKEVSSFPKKTSLIEEFEKMLDELEI